MQSSTLRIPQGSWAPAAARSPSGGSSYSSDDGGANDWYRAMDDGTAARRADLPASPSVASPSWRREAESAPAPAPAPEPAPEPPEERSWFSKLFGGGRGSTASPDMSSLEPAPAAAPARADTPPPVEAPNNDDERPPSPPSPFVAYLERLDTIRLAHGVEPVPVADTVETPLEQQLRENAARRLAASAADVVRQRPDAWSLAAFAEPAAVDEFGLRDPGPPPDAPPPQLPSLASADDGSEYSYEYYGGSEYPAPRAFPPIDAPDYLADNAARRARQRARQREVERQEAARAAAEQRARAEAERLRWERLMERRRASRTAARARDEPKRRARALRVLSKMAAQEEHNILMRDAVLLVQRWARRLVARARVVRMRQQRAQLQLCARQASWRAKARLVMGADGEVLGVVERHA